MIRTAILVAMVAMAGCAGDDAADDVPSVVSSWDITATACPGGSPTSLVLRETGVCTLVFDDEEIPLRWAATDYGISLLVDGQVHAGLELGGAFLLPGDEHADVETMYGDLPIGDCTAGLMLRRR